VSNKDLPLRKIVRASGAAPTFFAPESIEVFKGNAGFFVDGAVSPFNNPALLLFLVATTPSYGYGWAMARMHFRSSRSEPAIVWRRAASECSAGCRLP
jgi:hypothetical protein